MKPWRAYFALLAGLLVLVETACPGTAGAANLLGMEPAIPLVSDEALVFQSIRESVTRLQTALHRKVASVLTSKVAEKAEGEAYESTWLVTVNYWLDYAKPEDVPYLKGMLRCLSDCRATADEGWVAWAETQVEVARSSYAEEIAFQQELGLRALVTASLDADGKPVPSTLKVFHLVSDSEAVPMSAEIRAAPDDAQMEQAGYQYLKDLLSAESRSPGAGGEPDAAEPSTPQPGPSQSQPPSQPQSEPRSPSAGPNKALSPVRLTGPADRNRSILLAGIGLLVLLVLLLILNQYLLQKHR